MKKYQDTATPYILCTIAKDPQKRKQLSADSVEKLNMRTFEAAGIEATQNFSRHCDAKRTRKFPNRPEESGHSAKQDVAYENCTVDAESCVKKIRRPVPPAKIAARRRECDELRAKIAGKEQEEEQANPDN